MRDIDQLISVWTLSMSSLSNCNVALKCRSGGQNRNRTRHTSSWGQIKTFTRGQWNGGEGRHARQLGVVCPPCVFVCLCICVFMYLCICVFVHLCTCSLQTAPSEADLAFSPWSNWSPVTQVRYGHCSVNTCAQWYSTYCILWLSYIRYGHRNVNTCVHSTVCCILWLSWYAFTNMWNALFWSTSARLSRLSTVNAVNQM